MAKMLGTSPKVNKRSCIKKKFILKRKFSYEECNKNFCEPRLYQLNTSHRVESRCLIQSVLMSNYSSVFTRLSYSKGCLASLEHTDVVNEMAMTLSFFENVNSDLKPPLKKIKLPS